jgi:hypothetical protein
MAVPVWLLAAKKWNWSREGKEMKAGRPCRRRGDEVVEVGRTYLRRGGISASFCS